MFSVTRFTPPLAPDGFSIAPVRAPTPGLALTWRKVTRDVRKHQIQDASQTYRIYRAANLEALEDLTTLPSHHVATVGPLSIATTAPTLTWPDLDPSLVAPYGEQDFWYRIQCVDMVGLVSDPSAVLSGRVPDVRPPGPTGMLGSTGQADSITVYWAPNTEPDLAGYQVYRSICDRGKPYRPLLHGERRLPCDFALVGQVSKGEATVRCALRGRLDLIRNIETHGKHYLLALDKYYNTDGSLSPQQYKETIEVIRQLQQVLIAQNKIEPALELSEKGRSRAFVALLAGRITNNSGLKPDITSPTIAQIKQIAKATNSTLVTYSVIYDFQPYKTIRVQDQDLSNIPAKNLLIWVIKPTGKIAFKQVNLDQKQSLLAEQVQLARESIGASGRGLAAVARTQPDSRSLNNESLKQLHQLLIAPIADQLPTDPNDRITFIPQDTLFLVPFVALQDSAGKYLVEKHTILTSPSIQVLDLTHQQQQRIQDSAKGILIVGNPTMPSFSTQGSTPEQLPSLPGAEKEALAIAKLFNSQAIIGNQATKLTVEQRISQARIVHLATHGILDNTEGIFSSLALAPGNGDNGFLTAREILALKLNAELVVLSACDTGKGKITGGDGVVGLSRSFIGAGTPSIIVSLWSVPDAPTAELMTAFYQNLKNGLDKVQSLRSAILQTMKQFPNPRDWGAFTLIGEADTSKTLQAAIGGSPLASVSNNNSSNSSTNQDSSVQATRYTVFPVPNVFKGYRESPSGTVPGEIDVLFQSTLSVQELYNFYRQAFSQKGLKERASLSSFNERGFQLVFDGSANGHPIIIQVNDVPGFDRTVSIRFEN